MYFFSLKQKKNTLNKYYKKHVTFLMEGLLEMLREMIYGRQTDGQTESVGMCSEM